jgi:hypothetical protein
MNGIVAARTEWKKNSAPSPRARVLKRRVVTEEFRRFGEAIALLEWTDRCTILKVETLRPRMGAATALVEYLKRLVDFYEIPLCGNITAYVPDLPTETSNILSQQELETWYAKRGFALRRGSVGQIELWYPRLADDAQPFVAADAPQASRR